MGRRARKRRSSGARKHPFLLILAMLCALVAAGYLLEHPLLIVAGVLAIGGIVLLKIAVWHHRRRNRLAAARSIGQLLALSPAAFEETTAELLRSLGYRQMRRIGGPGDRGVDLTGRDHKGRVVVVQCKRYTPGNHVGSPAIQSFIGMMVQHRAERGLFVTTSNFTQPAIDLARDAPIPLALIDGQAFLRLAASASWRGTDPATIDQVYVQANSSERGSPPVPPARRPARPTRAADARAEPVRRCPVCGHRCKGSDRFCGQCGGPLPPNGAANGREPTRRAPELPAFPPLDREDHPW